MLSKLGFPILIIAFGALALFSGLLMPEQLRQKLPSPPKWLVKQFPGMAKMTQSLQSVGLEAKPKAVKPDDQAKAQADATPALESLSIPSPPPPKGSYGLQLGLFPDEGGADALAASVNGLQLPTIAAKTLKVHGRDGQNWWVAIAGEAGEPSELVRTQARLEELLSLRAIRPVLLPAPAKS